MRPGDPMHLGPGRTAAFIRQVLAERSYVVCHDTLTYGDFPGYGPASCRGFFDAYRTRSAALLILQAGRRLTEVPPPLVARAEELGRAAGKAAAGCVFDGNTPREEYQRVLRGIEEGDPAVLDATEPPAIGPAAGYDQDDLARDLGIEPASSPSAAACPAPRPPTPTPSPMPSGRKPSGPHATTPASARHARGLNHETPRKAVPGKGGTAREKNNSIRRLDGR